MVGDSTVSLGWVTGERERKREKLWGTQGLGRRTCKTLTTGMTVRRETILVTGDVTED